jgi:hypothetical protein
MDAMTAYSIKLLWVTGHVYSVINTNEELGKGYIQ